MSYLGNLALVVAPAAALNYTLRNPSTDKYIELVAPYRALIGKCYKLGIYLRYYNGTSYIPSPSTTVNFPSLPSELSLYTDSSCTTAFSPPLNMSGSGAALFFKVSNLNSNTYNFITATNASIDQGRVEIIYDKSGPSTLQLVNFEGEDLETRVSGQNRYLWHGFLTAQFTPFPISTSASVTYSLSGSTGGSICDTSGCSATSLSVVLGAAEHGHLIWYVPGATSGTATIQATENILNTVRNVSIVVNP